MRADLASFDLGDVIDRLHEGIQVVDRDFTYLYVNQVAAGHGQRPVEELVGRRMPDAFPGIEDTEMFQHLRRVLDHGGAHRMENEFVYRDGSRRWFELHIEGVPQGAIILSLDISSRKKLDLDVRRAQRMEAVGQLAGGVAHDFNNLLTVIQSYVSLAMEELPEGHSLRDDLGTVLAAADSAGELTHKLLGFARQLPVEPRRVAIRDALERLRSLLRRAVGDAVVLSVEIPRDVGAVRIDPGALDQVLLNLSINARDAMPSGGRLTILASQMELNEEWAFHRGVTLQPGRYVVVSVIDSGTGIPAELQDRIFDPFFSTKGEHGTGLGLATCWGLVQQAGGTMTVYSEEGIGTTFKVLLPLHEPEQPVAARQHEAPAARSQEAAGTILLVEDEEALRSLVGRVLRRAGYRILEAASGAEALLLMEDVGDSVDLLLSDVVMPRMSGHELVRRVRARHGRLRVLLMSGLAGSDGEAPEAGEAEVLAKPFTPSGLLSAVGRALAGGPGVPGAMEGWEGRSEGPPNVL